MLFSRYLWCFCLFCVFHSSVKASDPVKIVPATVDVLSIHGVQMLPLTSVPTVLTPLHDPINGNAVKAFGYLQVQKYYLEETTFATPSLLVGPAGSSFPGSSPISPPLPPQTLSPTSSPPLPASLTLKPERRADVLFPR
jgi:hypothetical protein